jgi:RNA polymerase sigma factor (sigma-70 family)
MAAIQEIRSAPSQLELNRETAIYGLRRYLSTPAERALHEVPGREHQASSLDLLLEFWAEGNTAGYFDLPTGAGKTVVAGGLIKATNLYTIVSSPTGTILDKTGRTIEDIAPNAKVSNYDGRSKSLAGNVLNTTPNSLEQLAQVPALAEGTQLLIVDENDLGTLSEKRHTLWRKFPNALIVGLTATPDFSQLQELVRSGKVDPNERWVGAFRDKIAQVTREELMERGGLTPLDIHMFQTRQTVGDVHITAKGKYDEREIDRYLNTEARNNLAIALVAGLGKLPAHVTIPDDLAEDIREVHEKIAGRRTVIFGLNIRHIEELAKRLRDVNVKAAAVHGRMKKHEIARIDEAHQRGILPVVLTDELFRRGWDSPTEVGIFLDVTQSGVSLSQGLGRIQRLAPGKTRACAIQLVDDFADSGSRPVYLPELFEPGYIIQGARRSTSGERQEKKSLEKTAKTEPVLTITGMNISAFIEETTSEELISRRFDGSSVEKINAYFDEVIDAIRKGGSTESVLDFYKRIAATLPVRMREYSQANVLDALNTDDSEERKNAERAFLMMNLRGILSIIEPLFTQNTARNEDILHNALLTVQENITTIDPKVNVNYQIRNILRRSEFIDLIADEDRTPVSIIRNSKYGAVLDAVNADDEPFVADEEEIRDVPPGEFLDETFYDEDESISTQNVTTVVDITAIAQETGMSEDRVKKIASVREETVIPDVSRTEQDPTSKVALDWAITTHVNAALNTLSEREARVLRLRYGLGEEQPHSLDEVAQEYIVTKERIRQIEKKTLDKLREPARVKPLEMLLDE